MLKTRVKPTDLRLLPPKKKAPITGQRTLRRTTSRADADVKTELDLRGQTVEEALGNLGLFIDKCVLNNISEVRIIHAKVPARCVPPYRKNCATTQCGRVSAGGVRRGRERRDHCQAQVALIYKHTII